MILEYEYLFYSIADGAQGSLFKIILFTGFPFPESAVPVGEKSTLPRLALSRLPNHI